MVFCMTDAASRTWKTTLRSIIALPDPDAPSTSSSHPSNVEVFPKGSIVLGLYPETTSFYRATVREAPRSQSGGGGGGARREVYMLEFVDDNQQIHQVEKDSVVRVSKNGGTPFRLSGVQTVAEPPTVSILMMHNEDLVPRWPDMRENWYIQAERAWEEVYKRIAGISCWIFTHTHRYLVFLPIPDTFGMTVTNHACYWIPMLLSLNAGAPHGRDDVLDVMDRPRRTYNSWMVEVGCEDTRRGISWDVLQIDYTDRIQRNSVDIQSTIRIPCSLNSALAVSMR